MLKEQVRREREVLSGRLPGASGLNVSLTIPLRIVAKLSLVRFIWVSGG